MNIVKADTGVRRARYKTDKPFDRIYKYIFSPKTEIHKLSAKEMEMKERWEHIWHLLCSDILTDRKAVKMQQEKYQDISERQAYEDLQNAKKLFGDGRNGTKAQKKAMANEWIIQMLKKAYDTEDYKAAEKLLLRFTRINGLDDTDGDALAKLLKKQRPAAIIFSSDPKELEKQKRELEKEITLDVDHEDVEDE
jgi:hypothetical protein